MHLLNTIRSSTKLVIGGHRGQGNSIFRENTISCFDTLVGKVPYIEVDVQLTSDGVLVLYHDYDLSLKTLLTGMIKDYTLDQLCEHFEVSTVEEVIRWAKRNNMGIAFELKLHPQTMWDIREYTIDELGRLIEMYNFFEQCFVFGVNYNVLTRLKKMYPKVPIGLIVPFIPENPVALMQEMQAELYLNYAHQLPFSLVETLSNAGYIVDGSIVNTKEELMTALRTKVHCIESDYPIELQKQLEDYYDTFG